MSFDGEFKTERPEFDSIKEAWEYSNNLGSKWYFYPFHFITTQSGKTIRSCPNNLETFDNLRVKTVKEIFNRISKIDEAQGVSAERYVDLLNGRN